jgi:hypothetical protein
LSRALDVERQLDVGLHGEELRAVGSQSCTLRRFSPDDALHLVGVRDHALERAVLLDQLARGLRAHLVDARHVVDRVAHEREVVDDALRRHAELRLHARGSSLSPTWCSPTARARSRAA